MRPKNSIVGSLILLLCGLVACSPRVDNRGYVDPTSNLEKIQEGKSTKEEVRDVLGSPSAQSNFGQEAWYYINGRKESNAFFRPEVKDQHVTRVVFGDDGRVETIERYSLQDRQDIEVVKDYTKTEGQQLGVVEQLLGNLGRFNKGREDAKARNISKGGRPY